MTGRIDRRFAELKKEGRAALVTFTMAGDPDHATSVAILKALPKAGADVIELGMPFTDPMADGPAIQAAGLRALKAGQNMKKTLAAVRDFRAASASACGPQPMRGRWPRVPTASSSARLWSTLCVRVSVRRGSPARQVCGRLPISRARSPRACAARVLV